MTGAQGMTGTQGMTGASPVTTIYGSAWLRHAVERCIVVTPFTGVMLYAVIHHIVIPQVLYVLLVYAKVDARV